MTIIFTCAGRRNYLISYFKEIIGNTGKIIALDNQDSAPALQIADIGIVMPITSSETYIPKLKEIILKYKADLLIPLNDLELPTLSEHKNSLESLGVKVIISNKQIVDMSLDKWESFKFLKSSGFDTPKTFLKIEDAMASIESKEICFPLIVKPRWGSGSVEIHIVKSKKELGLAYALLELKKLSLTLQRLNRYNDNHFIVIQEFLGGKEYGMDVLNDFNGNFVEVFVREKIAMRAGETDKAKTIDDKKFKEIGEKLGNLTGHLGIMDCDFFVGNGKISILEMNPRFGGGYPFTHTAGVNIPAIYVNWFLGKKNITPYLNYKTGLLLSKYDNIMPIKKLALMF